MKIAIVGAGFGGLSAAWHLQKGYQITLFEKEKLPGGLAIGFKHPNWEWSLEKHYHHIFKSDTHIQQIADEVGQPYKFYDAKTYSLFESGTELEYWRLDSPLALLKFGKVPILQRLRTGAALGYMRYLSNWQDFEKVTSREWLIKWTGKTSYQLLWEPLFLGKFGQYADEVNAAWFWSRIKSRSQKLGYFDGGFLALAQKWLKKITDGGGQAIMGQEIADLTQIAQKFDRVVVAGAPRHTDHPIHHVGTVNTILRLKQKFLPHSIYWLSVHLPNSPILAIVEHTNLISQSHYGNEHLVYISKYLAHDHPFMTIPDADLLKHYAPLLSRINPHWKNSLIGFDVFRAKYTQPVIPVNYSRSVPPFATADPKVYTINMQQIYPWDRGTSLAIDLGKKLADIF